MKKIELKKTKNIQKRRKNMPDKIVNDIRKFVKENLRLPSRILLISMRR